MQAIAAVASNRVIGNGGRLPWSIAADWRHFMQRTVNSALIMGRVSFEDMLNEPRWAADGRTYHVVSRERRFANLGPVSVHSSPMEALAAAKAEQRTVWVCGGANIYQQLLSECDRLWLTLVQKEFPGDTYFPQWKSEFPVCHELGAAEENGLKFAFTVWDKAAKLAANGQEA